MMDHERSNPCRGELPASRACLGLPAALALAVLAGCPSGGEDPSGAAAPPAVAPSTRAAAPPAPPPPSGKAGPVVAPSTPDAAPAAEAGPVEGVASNDGTFYVEYSIDPHPLPLNEVFSLHIAIFDAADRSRRLTDVELAVDGRMPMHRHGMNREPVITRNEDGTFTVAGMLFHMPGDWVFHFDVTRQGITERAQADFVLE